MAKVSVVSVNVNGSRSCVEETQANPDVLLVVLLSRLSCVYYSTHLSLKRKEPLQLERKASGSGSVLVLSINCGT